MNFNNKQELMNFLKCKLTFIGSGSQGECYLDKNTNSVYKIFIDYIEEDICFYSEEDLLKFKNIKNNTFVFATDIVRVNENVVGYISKYVNATNLYKLNPLNVNLDKFNLSIKKAKKDIDFISKNKIKLYDIPYNILLGSKIYVTDFDDFNYTDVDLNKLKNMNNYSFNLELFWFLVDGYFNEFVKSNNELSELYETKDDIIMFLKLFRRDLSEYVGIKINKLNECKKYLNKKIEEPIYLRFIEK